MLLDLRSLGCGLYVCAAAQFEASPREIGVTCVGAGSQQFAVLGCCGSPLWCCVTPGSCSASGGFATMRWATGGRWLSQTFLGQGKNKGFGERSLLEEAHPTSLLFAR